ncbi:hypothetical protein AGMMS49992_30780 [Clostridia bacterium]|nr:hypothetical protein AGMMS49992_30780 [Clostridia bacterium]
MAVDPTLMTDLLKATSEGERARVRREITKNIAEQLPSTSWTDKANALRYLTMLTNPKTHIRNIMGNAVFTPAVQIKNVVAQGIERVALPQEQRTKSMFDDKALRDFAAADFEANEGLIAKDGSIKKKSAFAFTEAQNPFGKGKVAQALNAVSNLNSNLMDAEDTLFLRGYYIQAMSGFMQARGIDPTTAGADVIQQARSYALAEAEKATYHDASLAAQNINKLSKDAPAAARMLIEGVVPFKKTPVNVLKRGIEYSPIGLVDTITHRAAMLKDGKINAAQFIDSLSAGLTGTGVAVLGAFLKRAGILNGSMGDEPEDKLKKLEGYQPYSINLPGGWNYTIDWTSPTSMALFVGAEVGGMLEKDHQLSLGEAMRAFTFAGCLEQVGHEGGIDGHFRRLGPFLGYIVVKLVNRLLEEYGFANTTHLLEHTHGLNGLASALIA